MKVDVLQRHLMESYNKIDIIKAYTIKKLRCVKFHADQSNDIRVFLFRNKPLIKSFSDVFVRIEVEENQLVTSLENVLLSCRARAI